MKIEDIKKLAILSRMDMNDNEMLEIASSFDSILAYVGQVQEISKDILINGNKDLDTPINVTREDIVTNNRKEYTEKIIKEMPHTHNEFLKVKQIL